MMETATQTPSPPLAGLSSVAPSWGGPLRVLTQAALLAGLGVRARQAALESVSGAACAAARTCIDGGGKLLLTLRAEKAARRGLGVLTPLPQANSSRRSLWGQRWLGPGPSRPAWRIEAFGAGPQAWRQALEASRRNRCQDQFSQLHAQLGPLGSIRFVARSEQEARCWVAWQLDRNASAAEALDRCGAGQLWDRAAETFGQLLGRSPRPCSRSWSIAAWLGQGPLRLRLGTSLWGLQPEDARKRSRMRQAVAQMGGDAAFAEAVYKLIRAARSPDAHRSCLGRAAELEIVEGRIERLELFLRA
ncbi:MAG: hypothetical protein V3T83_11415 [Acidobacteriota bacterium]